MFVDVKDIIAEDKESRVAIFNGQCVYDIKMFSTHIIIDTETGKVLLQESTIQSVLSTTEEPSINFPYKIRSLSVKDALSEDTKENRVVIGKEHEDNSEGKALKKGKCPYC